MPTVKIKPNAEFAARMERDSLERGAELLGRSQVRLLLSRYYGHDQASFLRGIMAEAGNQLEAKTERGVVENHD